MADSPLDLTDEDRAMLSDVGEEVQEAAKKSFSLADRLNGVKLATAKVVVFTDLDTAAEWQRAEQRVRQAAARLRVAQQADEPDQEEVDDALEAHNEAEAESERLRDEAFASALAVHMRAVPQVAFEAAQRKARKEFTGDSGEVPEEKRPDFFERQNEILLGQVVTRIVDAQGNEAEYTKAGLHKMLRDALPIPQFTRVIEAFNALMFNDSLARAATADPGF